MRHWEAMGVVDVRRRTRFVIDEWGLWYPSGSELAPAYILSQTITMRDALHTALTFDIFNRHADKIAMANVAQTINCLHSLFLAQEDQFVRTPVYHVFEMYRPHMGAKSIPLKINSPDLSVTSLDGPARIPGLSGSASIRDRRLFVTLTNFSLDEAVKVNLSLGSLRGREARARILTHADHQATNTFARRDSVQPQPFQVRLSGSGASCAIPPKALVSVEIDLV